MMAGRPQMLRPSPDLIGWIAAFTVLLVWSGWVVVSRLGVVLTLTVYDMAALRFAVASLAVAPFAWRFWPRGLRFWKIAVLSCGPGAPYVLLAFSGMEFAPASHAGIMMNGTLPVLAALIGWWWLKEKPTLKPVVGMGIILCGAVLIAWDRKSVGVGSDAWIGHLSFIASAKLLVCLRCASPS